MAEGLNDQVSGCSLFLGHLLTAIWDPVGRNCYTGHFAPTLGPQHHVYKQCFYCNANLGLGRCWRNWLRNGLRTLLEGNPKVLASYAHAPPQLLIDNSTNITKITKFLSPTLSCTPDNFTNISKKTKLASPMHMLGLMMDHPTNITKITKFLSPALSCTG
jgi:hypothetical protein